MPEPGEFAPDSGAPTFASLGVPAPIVGSLADDGITAPFPVQAATLPDALAGRDVLGRAQTGSGKTLGFSIPLVTRLADGATAPHRPRGLVLVPTRELATQVEAVLAPLARSMGLRVATVYGGVSYRPQIIALERATDILVACPGRLEDLIKQGECDLSAIEITVIDEADQMADLGFLPIVRRMLEATPAGGQRLLFSATLDGAIDVLAKRFLSDPARHSVDENSSPAEIEHHLLTIGPKRRLEVVEALAGGDKRSLVFTRTKHGAQRLARQLTDAGIPAAELHGNLRQGARAKNLAAFSTGVAQVMVATDIAARGIHVDNIELVIHADPPAEHKAYVHRSGRTARGGADGIVVTLQTNAQSREVRRLMRDAGITPQRADAEPDSDVLREIAGDPVPRVRLPKPVTDMVRLPKRHPARGAEDSRPGEGRHGDGRRGDGRRGYGDGRRGNAARRGADGRRPGQPRRRDDRPFHDDRPFQEDRPRRDRPARDDRPSREDRPFRDDQPRRDSQPFRGDRPFRENRPQRDDRPYREDRPFRDDRPYRDDRPRRDDQARQEDRPRRDGQPFRGDRPFRENRPQHDDRPARGDRYPDGNRRAGEDRYSGGERAAQRDRRDGWASDRAPESRTPENRAPENRARDDRRSRDDWAPRDQGRRGPDSGGDRDGRDRQDDRGSRPGSEHSFDRNGRPSRPGGTGRHQASNDRRPSRAGGRTGRPEFPGRPGTGRQRRNSGQGRHY